MLPEEIRLLILNELRTAAKNNEYMSDEQLRQRLNITRAAIWKHISFLGVLGYEISSETDKGYKLTKVPDLLLPYELKNGLQAENFGRVINYYPVIESTNYEAKRLAENRAIEGTLVIAEKQSAGRGRHDRSWESPEGGLWLTLILRPKISPDIAPILTLLTGKIVAEIIHELTGLEAKLKWPNDVRINGKKVCGIMTELSTEQDQINYILVGVGVNINIPLDKFPPALREQATSIQEELKQKINRVEFTQRLIERFEKEYISFTENPQAAIPEIIKHWRQLSDTLGRNVTVETISGKRTGLAADIDNDGALIVVAETGERHRIIAGDCIYTDQ
jgi:BirA family biotin operon repressor/biotin-[acetyl-CoA-carboxylase] ligase